MTWFELDIQTRKWWLSALHNHLNAENDTFVIKRPLSEGNKDSVRTEDRGDGVE